MTQIRALMHSHWATLIIYRFLPMAEGFLHLVTIDRCHAVFPISVAVFIRSLRIGIEVTTNIDNSS